MSFPTGAAEGWGPRVLLCSLRVAQTHLDDGARGPRTLGQCHPKSGGSWQVPMGHGQVAARIPHTMTVSPSSSWPTSCVFPCGSTLSEHYIF